MTGDKIIQLANSLKIKYGTKDPIELCKNLKIKISTTKIKPEIFPAYILHVSENPSIVLNEHYTINSQKILCAHELGHALLHKENILNQFKGDSSSEKIEYEANLFAVALLFNRSDFKIDILKMNNYLLEGILDYNLKLKHT
ncbi:ImmA/IrrE family metallo-endopeptidase [Oceanirhabdus seepicola]|uniref:ImmA/IrrE family metallo-endopeptidase n=1 Tax=Oceanirhabdus seepicola TaxID=2828781 RepID=A0A9J6NYV3_9CLOT|nr:ImmA/IrrE family metallo-endopeptidase [Oceanirhabdus seepicola]MCM1988797.1 ImmA/IrrE family metallo-endopeptidase [Oceanirhabdus seepicola]